MRSNMKLSVVVSLMLAVIFAVALVQLGLVSPDFTSNLYLAYKYLSEIPLQGSLLYTGSPEIVTSVLWDQRGIDTYYETTVLFLAIIGTLYIFAERIKPSEPSKEMTVIVKLIAKVVAPIIMIVSISVALHGHLTPGGGFQGGSIFVVAPLILLAAMGGSKLIKLGFKKDSLLSLRLTGLILIAFIGISTLIIGFMKGVMGYLFLNQPKTYVPLGYADVIYAPWGEIVIAGTLILLNLMEFLAVSAGFTLALLGLDAVVEGGKK